MFVWKASVILEQFKEFLPEVYACLVKIGDAMGTDSEMEAINEIYPVIPSISIDYGIMEKSDIVKVISADTVSYTHLRAHETDSYLVCRLLLEKKKTNKKKNNTKKKRKKTKQNN